MGRGIPKKGLSRGRLESPAAWLGGDLPVSGIRLGPSFATEPLGKSARTRGLSEN